MVDLDRMVDNKVNGNEGLDDTGIFAHPAGSATHGREVAEQGDTGEILEQDTADDKWDLFGAMVCRLPGCELPDVRLRDLFAVAIAKDRFEDDTDRDRKAGDPAEPGLFQRGQGMELSFFACTGIEIS
jgi:hypothetical protein